ncbi:Nitronate monooxygenase [Halomonadaceae bacterium LMG 33818]|uniref:NAD(P)H-dependent flavin oxidoreductase n=1 Tax=Cernens ardua TaxID=3402176 RepID=UPI003EDB9CCA
MALSFLESLGVIHAIVQSPMAGGATTPALVSAVSNAGALGSLAGSSLSPEEIVNTSRAIRALTERPFAINLFIQEVPAPSPDTVAHAIRLLQPLYDELALAPPLPARWCQPFEQQFEAVLDSRPSVASFTFGILSIEQVEALKACDIRVVGTATHPDEVIAWSRLGVDAISLQGKEAGGHRGTFSGRCEDALWPLDALLSAAKQITTTPLIVAGGIMTAADIQHYLALGAEAAQLGTAFLTTHESGIPPAYKQALMNAQCAPEFTRGFSGRLAKGLPNHAFRFLQKIAQQVPDYPVQNALTAALRAQGKRLGNAEYLSLWAGDGVHRVRDISVRELIEELTGD